MNTLSIKETTFGSKDYRKELAIREEVLRVPLELSFSQEEMNEDLDDIHISGFSKNTMIGTLILFPQNEETIRLRQIAVCSDFQRKSIGKKLIEFGETVAKGREYRKIILFSQEYMIPFYANLGYTVNGDRFESVTLPHFCMQKHLA